LIEHDIITKDAYIPWYVHASIALSCDVYGQPLELREHLKKKNNRERIEVRGGMTISMIDSMFYGAASIVVDFLEMECSCLRVKNVELRSMELRVCNYDSLM
jgi:hypothetical protein